MDNSLSVPAVDVVRGGEMEFTEGPAMGFNTTPMEGGHRYSLTTLLGLFLRILQSEFGPRDKEYTPLGIEFGHDGPQVWYPGNCGNVSIMLSDEARMDPNRAAFQLAHESVHLLSPSGAACANVAEEGLATWFADKMSNDLSLIYLSDGSSYLQAKQKVQELFAVDRDAVRKVRSAEPQFSKWTADLLMSIVPDVPVELAKELCQRFSL